MSAFRLKKAHSMSREELRDTARALADRLESQHGLQARWHGEDVVAITGSGLDGCLSINDDEIEISVKLGLLVSAFKGKLQAEIQRYLDENIS